MLEVLKGSEFVGRTWTNAEQKKSFDVRSACDTKLEKGQPDFFNLSCELI